jgi:rhamnosyltransferase
MGEPGNQAVQVGNVLAAVVTFCPEGGFARNLEALRRQVANVLLIDNSPANRSGLEFTARASGCQFRRNPGNLGVAKALNQAAEAALDGGFEWLAMFDQDSLVPEGAIADLLAVYEAHPARERIAVMAMSHRDRATGLPYLRGSDVLDEGPEWRSVRATITSGSLVRREVLEKVGPFDEALFIDGVDHDFCLRCRRAGYLVIEGRRPVLEHSMGSVSLHRLLGRTIACTNHSPTRRYYMTRNSLELSARHVTSDPLWALRNVTHLVDSSLSALAFEDRRGEKTKAMIQGVWHFMTRQFGPRLPAARDVGD